MKLTELLDAINVLDFAKMDRRLNTLTAQRDELLAACKGVGDE